MRPHPITAAEAGAGVVYLLEADIAGQRVKVSSEEFPGYTTGLVGLTFARQLDFLSSEAPKHDANVEVILPDLDIPALAMRGGPLNSVPATLYLTTRDRDEADRIVLIDGVVKEPEYGDPDEPYVFTITAQGSASTRMYPDVDAAISSRTLPYVISDANSAQEQTPYPTIIGRPGKTEIYEFKGSSAYIFGEIPAPGIVPLVLVAGHACGPDYNTVAEYDYSTGTGVIGSSCGGTVSVIDLTTGIGVPFQPVYNMRDKLGRVVAVCKLDAYGSGGFLDPDDGSHTYAIKWHTAYGIQRDDGARLRGAGSVLEWAMQAAGVNMDTGRFRSARRFLDTLKIDAVIEERVDLKKWVEQSVLPLLPVSLSPGANGIYPCIWNDALALPTVLEEGVNIWRDARPLIERDVYAKVNVSYAWDVVKKGTTGTTSTSPSSITRAASFRTDAEMDVEGSTIASSLAAQWVSAWKTRAYGAEKRVISYSVGLDLLSIQPGDIYRLIDSKQAIDDYAFVSSVEYHLNRVTIEVRV